MKMITIFFISFIFFNEAHASEYNKYNSNNFIGEWIIDDKKNKCEITFTTKRINNKFGYVALISKKCNIELKKFNIHWTANDDGLIISYKENKKFTYIQFKEVNENEFKNIKYKYTIRRKK